MSRKFRIVAIEGDFVSSEQVQMLLATVLGEPPPPSEEEAYTRGKREGEAAKVEGRKPDAAPEPEVVEKAKKPKPKDFPAEPGGD